MTPSERQFLIDLLQRGAQLPSARELAETMLEIDARRTHDQRIIENPPLVAGGQGREPAELLAGARATFILLCIALAFPLFALAWRIFA